MSEVAIKKTVDEVLTSLGLGDAHWLADADIAIIDGRASILERQTGEGEKGP